ncbi:MAG: hypothetical protein JNK72_21395 [Myxococcales bacterium]|nr:hypothetical protein [Myxococcales bacterium]
MADAPPSKRPTPQRKPVNLTEPRPAIFEYLPYFGVIAAVIGLILTIMKSPAWGITAAVVLLVGLVLALAWVGWQHTLTLKPGDRLKPLIGLCIGLVCVLSLGPIAITVHPPAPAGVVDLRRVGERQEVTVSGAAATVFLQVSSSFKADVGTDARARYSLTLTRDGGPEETVEGSFERSSSQQGGAGRGPASGGGTTETTATRHVLQLRGAGRYALILDRFPESLEPPMHVTVHAEPLSQSLLMVLFGFAALAVLGCDVAIRRKGIESAFAASQLLLLAAVFYLHGHFTPSTRAMDLLAAGLVGVLGGGVGGEILGRIADAVTPRRG